MSDTTSYAKEFSNNCKYYLNVYPVTPDIVANMAQQSILLNQKLSQAITHINALVAEIEQLNANNGESK